MALVNRLGNFSGTIQGVRHSSATGVSSNTLNIDWSHATIASGIRGGRIAAQWDQNASNGYIALAHCVFQINFSPATGRYYLRFLNIAYTDSPGSTVLTQSIVPYWFDGSTETLGETGVLAAASGNYIRFKMVQSSTALAASPATSAFLIREI